MTMYILCLDLAYDGINIVGVYTTYDKALDAAIERAVTHSYNEYAIVSVDNVDGIADIKDYPTRYFCVKQGEAVVQI